MRLRWFGVALVLGLFAVRAKGAPRVEHGGIPLFFVQMEGSRQVDADFVLRNDSMTVEFRTREVVYHFDVPGAREVRVHYLGAHAVHAEGLEPLTGKVNFLVGSDPSAWRRNATAYASIGFRETWTGIDVDYSLAGGRLKTEFEIAPGADAQVVRWRIDGADAIRLERGGELVVSAGTEELREDAPQVFQQDRLTGELRGVKGAFRILSDGTLGIEVGEYDHANRLIFDPVIGFSTYIGGSGQSAATAVAEDSEGDAVIAGYTTSLDILPGAASLGEPQRTVAFIAKVAAAGNQLIFCTYLGGSIDDRAYALALDRWNNIYVAGATSSRNFPAVNAVQPHLNGGEDAFAAELNPAGTALIFSTYLGGSGTDQAYGIGLNRQGNVFVTGDTQSTDFPTVKPFQAESGGGQDAFLVKLGVSGSGILYSSYLGGNGDDHAAALAVDSTGAVVVTGSTFSSNFPVVDAFQPQTGGNQDAFITKVNASGTALVFSTYAGGTGGTPGLPEYGSGVAVDSSGSVYVAGTTSSSNFPVTVHAFQTTPAGGLLNAFAMKLSSSGALIYGSYLGGSSVNYANAIAVDSAGNAHVTGYTASSDFPSLHSFQNGLNGFYNMFITKLNSTGSALIYSTLLGGSASDSAAAIAVDRNATVLIAGQSQSADFPAVNAAQSTQQGSGAAVVARIPVGWTPALVKSSNTPQWSVDALLASTSGTAQALSQAFAISGGDIPLVGDWSGRGYQCTGTFRAGVWQLDVNCDGIFDAGDRSFVFGQAGDIAVVGDWNGTGSLKAGLFRAGTFILDLSGHLSGIPTGQNDISFSFGEATDIPVVGDWNSSGFTKVGVFRNGEWLLDWNGTHAITSPAESFGEAGDIPLTGDWDGSGTVKAGVYRKGTFLLDYDGNWSYNPSRDITLPFGPPASYAFMMY
jgi:hypothetical protein